MLKKESSSSIVKSIAWAIWVIIVEYYEYLVALVLCDPNLIFMGIEISSILTIIPYIIELLSIRPIKSIESIS